MVNPKWWFELQSSRHGIIIIIIIIFFFKLILHQAKDYASQVSFAPRAWVIFNLIKTFNQNCNYVFFRSQVWEKK